jgi:hypothetical protein
MIDRNDSRISCRNLTLSSGSTFRLTVRLFGLVNHPLSAELVFCAVDEFSATSSAQRSRSSTVKAF